MKGFERVQEGSRGLYILDTINIFRKGSRKFGRIWEGSGFLYIQ